MYNFQPAMEGSSGFEVDFKHPCKIEILVDSQQCPSGCDKCQHQNSAEYCQNHSKNSITIETFPINTK